MISSWDAIMAGMRCAWLTYPSWMRCKPKVDNPPMTDLKRVTVGYGIKRRLSVPTVDVDFLAKLLVDENVVVLDSNGYTIHKYGTLVDTTLNHKEGKLVAVVKAKCGHVGNTRMVTMYDVRDADRWCSRCYSGVTEKLRFMVGG